MIDLTGVTQFPSYKFVRDAKELCLPTPKDDWVITDFSVEINLQKIDHTAKGFLKKKKILMLVKVGICQN